MICALVAICLFGRAVAQVPTWNCSDHSVENFNKAAFLGTWYRVEQSQQPTNIDCQSLTFVVENGVDYINYEYRNRLPDGKSNEPNLTPGQYVPLKAKAQLSDGYMESDITATDYTSYVVVCTRDSREPPIAIYSRDQHPTETVLTRIRDILKEKNIGGVKHFNPTPSDCKPTVPVSGTN